MLTSDKAGYGNKTSPNVSHTQFLGLTTDNRLSWKNHTDLHIHKLSTACYVLRSVKAYMSHSTLIITYYSLFHSVITYGTIFWGKCSHILKIFKIQMRADRIIMGHNNRDSCRTSLKKL